DLSASKSEAPWPFCTMASPSMIADLQRRLAAARTMPGEVAPIIAIATKHKGLAALNHHLRAVAIMLDFVNPVLPIWRLRSKLWLDEPESGSYHQPVASESAAISSMQLFHQCSYFINEGSTSLQIVGQPYPRSSELGE